MPTPKTLGSATAIGHDRDMTRRSRHGRRVPGHEGGHAISAARRLADAIEAAIVEGSFPQGHVLGSERDLCIGFEASPGTLRQATRLLESKGVARMRSGAGGGLVVLASWLDGAARAIATQLEFERATAEDLLNSVHLVIYLSGMASARNMSLASADRIRAALRSGEGVSDPYERSIRRSDVFTEMAKASGNPILPLFFRAGSFFWIDVVPFEIPQYHSAVDAEATQDIFDRNEIWRQKRISLVDAIIGGDVQHSAIALNDFFDGNRQMLRAVQSKRYSVQSGQNTFPVDLPVDPKGRTRGDAIARQILDLVRERDWEYGIRIGTESELMRRYSASRDVFRQSLKILEENGIVRSRRGPQGGIFVSRPELPRMFTLVNAGLSRSEVEPSHVDEIALPMTLKAWDLAVARDPDLRAREMIALIRRGKRSGTTLTGTIEALRSTVIASADSPVLTLHLAILRQIREHVVPAKPAPGADEARQPALDACLASLEQGDLLRAKRAFLSLIAPN